jgi:16S rRNA (cytidine1402-2'-O)-methyltransferase
VSFREQNASKSVPLLINLLLKVHDVALVTDAGTPSISDPGGDLVAAAMEHDIKVSPVPGASALAAAISVSPLKGDGVRFAGFLPRGGKNRKQRIGAIAEDVSCTVIYESPLRLHKTLLELELACGNREALVLRELTKKFEEIKKGSLGELAKYFNKGVKGEITLIISGNERFEGDILSDGQLKTMIKERLSKGQTAKDIAVSLSFGVGVSRRKIYAMAIELLNDNLDE